MKAPRLPGARPLAALLSLLACALGGWLAVKGLPHALLYPAAVVLLAHAGLLHGLDASLAPLALAPLVGALLWFVVGAGFALAGGWEQLLPDALSLLLASVSLAGVYASGYFAGLLLLRGRISWEEGAPSAEARGTAAPEARPPKLPKVRLPKLRLPKGVGAAWRRLALGARGGRRGRRRRGPL